MRAVLPRRKKGPRITSRRGKRSERTSERERAETRIYGRKGVLIQPSFNQPFRLKFRNYGVRPPPLSPSSLSSFFVLYHLTDRKSTGIRRSSGSVEGIKDEAGTALPRRPRKHPTSQQKEEASRPSLRLQRIRADRHIRCLPTKGEGKKI